MDALADASQDDIEQSLYVNQQQQQDESNRYHVITIGQQVVRKTKRSPSSLVSSTFDKTTQPKTILSVLKYAHLLQYMYLYYTEQYDNPYFLVLFVSTIVDMFVAHTLHGMIFESVYSLLVITVYYYNAAIMQVTPIFRLAIFFASLHSIRVIYLDLLMEQNDIITERVDAPTLHIDEEQIIIAPNNNYNISINDNQSFELLMGPQYEHIE
ncbi:hypothetical protein DFA_10372 [Cavenderia fasciculata]|uniref:Transmembrane protein n=1 Tax=Cavenderia fasciculata TaxID=261658 RepID=F4QA11_CACFS|nr:uncharacterized protein DFA_10372 [Cavenderia fasciculata]EGG15530.1 hypothetical protein DFA_10372 [Cavenderia fasciculata]|eukprot:XP_004354272.1 hypothetical protein DFA_10372 [Cavenderia fasciculata]